MATKLDGIADILEFFRTNTTPLFFVSAISSNLLGLEKWVNHWSYINYFDSFDGQHPRIFVPSETGPREFWSLEEVGNYLLAHKEVIDHLRAQGKRAKIILVMFDQETEELAQELGIEIALPPAQLRKWIDSKLITTKLGNEANCPSVPNVMGRAQNYDELLQLAANAQLGSNLVVQLPYGDSGRTTFFIKDEKDWRKHASKFRDEELKIMRHINHMPGTLEACVTRHGTLVGPMMTDITGFKELTPYKGGWAGNDIFPAAIAPERQRDVRAMVQRLGDRLGQEGYKGVFCCDYLIDTDTGQVYLGEINPRVSGATPPTNLITSQYAGIPLFLFHLLEFMDVDYTIDVNAIQERWNTYETWNQLILKQIGDEVEQISRAPASGIWRMHENGAIEFARRAFQYADVADENEAFYLRVYGPGQYRYHGADLGILVSRGRMQTDARQFMERAKLWAKAINDQFSGSAPATAATFAPPTEWSIYKMV